MSERSGQPTLLGRPPATAPRPGRPPALPTPEPQRSHGQPSTQSRLRRVAPPLLLAGGLLAASVALHLRDPHQAGSWGVCPLAALTGLACPGCGGLRAVNDLTNGDLGAAASSNLLFVASLPLLAGLWLRSVAHRWRGVDRPLPAPVVRAAATGAVVLVVAFGVLRNLPGMSWLLP